MPDSPSPELLAGGLPLPVNVVSPRHSANRRNARRSTGPKTIAGKRRSSLNRLRRNLCPADLERDMRAHGEDPREFCRLHRDLIAIFRPKEPTDVSAVELMARTWWAKARRIRERAVAGPVNCDDLDGRLEKLLLYLVTEQRVRHEWWAVWLKRVVGSPIGSPAKVRRQIESRLFVFGGSRRTRKYPRDPHARPEPAPFDSAYFERIFGANSGGASSSGAGTARVADAAAASAISKGLAEMAESVGSNSNEATRLKSLLMKLISS